MAGFTKTLVCSFLLGISCPVAALAYSYDEIVQMVQAEEKAFGRADYSKSLDQRLEALEAKEFGGAQSGSDSLRLRHICRELGLPQREGSVIAAPYNVVVADKNKPSSSDANRDAQAAKTDKLPKIANKAGKTKIQSNHARKASTVAKRTELAKAYTKISQLPTQAAPSKTQDAEAGRSSNAASSAIAATQSTDAASNFLSAPTSTPGSSESIADNKSALYSAMFAAVLGIIGICGVMIAFLQREKSDINLRYARNFSYQDDSQTDLPELESNSCEFDAEPALNHDTFTANEQASPQISAPAFAVSEPTVLHYESNPFACLESPENSLFLLSVEAASSALNTTDKLNAEADSADNMPNSFESACDFFLPNTTHIDDLSLNWLEALNANRSLEMDRPALATFEQLSSGSAELKYNEISFAYSHARPNGFAKLLEAKSTADNGVQEESPIGEIFELLKTDLIDVSVDDNAYEPIESADGDYRLSEFIIAISNFDDNSEQNSMMAAQISTVSDWILCNGRSMSVISANATSSSCNDGTFSAVPADEWGEESYHALAQLLIDAAGMNSINKTRAKRLVVPQNIPVYGRRITTSRSRESHQNDREYQNRLRGLFSEC